jgi:hypothetical protein
VLSEEELTEISRNPIELKRWYMHMVMHWRRLAHNSRKRSRHMGFNHSVRGYRKVFDDGHELMHWASVEDAMADIVGSDIDTWVRTTLEPAKCTCSITHTTAL